MRGGRAVLNGERLDHAWIACHIPHQGAMCLLESVEAWDEQRIECRANSHRAAGNPLRADGRLAGACAIEYAAQAMAVHGALLAPEGASSARVGYLVSVRDARLYIPRLDNVADDLTVTASCLTRSENNIVYQFSVCAAGRLLADGRAAVIINAEALTRKSA